MPSKNNGKGVGLAVHFGQTLLNQADMYPTIATCIKELVSNGLDAGANRIEVIYDLKVRTLVVRDNGKGRSPEDFQRDLMNVGNSSKRGDKNKIGRYGIGMMSPLGKCSRFTFTSWDGRKDQSYIRFIFNCKAIIESAVQDAGEKNLVTQEELIAVVHESRGKTSPDRTAVWWKSEMYVHNIDKDRALTRFEIDEFVHTLLTNLNKSLLANNAKVSIVHTDEEGRQFRREKIEGVKFAGRPLEIFGHKSSTADQVIFGLHVAPRTIGGYKGEVIVQVAESAVFTLGWKQIAKQLKDHHYASQDAIEALSSGFFEGEIVSSGCVVHKNRTTLENSERLMELGIAVDSWFAKVGSAEYRSIRTNERDARFNELGTQALGSLKGAMLKNIALRNILDQFKSVCRFGSVGKGHSAVIGKQIGLTPIVGIAVNNKPLRETGDGVENISTREKRNTSSQGGVSNPGHSPIVHLSPEAGFSRKRTAGDSLGIHVMQTEDTVSDRLWTFDDAQGVIQINVLHPLWAKHEKSDKTLVRLQLICLVQAVSYMVARPLDREAAAERQQCELLMFDHLII